jgi:hypothetical protein
MADMAADEADYRLPLVQFGCTTTDRYYAISSFAVGCGKSLNRLKLIWSEFDTGALLGTMSAIGGTKSLQKGWKIHVYDVNGTKLENSFNDLVQAELGDFGFYRGDPRIFNYPNGEAGVFIERTGAVYRLTETSAVPTTVPTAVPTAVSTADPTVFATPV